MNRVLRAVAITALWPAGIALIVGSGTDATPTRIDPLVPSVAPVATPSPIAILQQDTADVRIDASFENGTGTVAGFGVDLPESIADIAIDTASCPPGVGSASCQMWSITPGSRSIPGLYLIGLTPQQPSGPVNSRTGRLDLEVLPQFPMATRAAIQVDSSAAQAVNNDSHALFIDATGRLWGFGRSVEGQVATSYLRTDSQARVLDSQPYRAPAPVQIGVPEYSWTQVIAAGHRSFALRSNGTVYRWGNAGNLMGPELITGPANIRAIALSRDNDRPAMLDADGRLFREDGAELQIGTGPNSAAPLTGARGLAAVSDPNFDVLPTGPFAVLSDGRVAEFEVGAFPEQLPVIEVITGYRKITSIAAGGTHLLGLDEDGAVMALGKNSAGQLGTGGTSDQVCSERNDSFCATSGSTQCLDSEYRCNPIQVIGLGPAQAVAAKHDRSFALLRDGTVWTWGGGITTPVQVQNLQNIRAISGGYAIGSECQTGGSLWGITFPSSGPPTATRVPGVGDLSICTGIAEIGVDVEADTLILNLDTPPLSRSIGIDVARLSYTGPVTLALNGCPFQCEFSPNPVPPDQTHATLTITRPATGTMTPIPYELKIVTATGTGGVAPARDTFVFRTVGGAAAAPTADFSFTPSEPRSGQAVSFDGSASADDDPLVSYQWDFTNDGTFDATGATASNTYPEPGTFTARLRVTDADGQTNELTRVINVQPASPSTVTLVVHVTGPGSVHISPGNIDCELECERTFDLVTPPTIAQLSPNPGEVATFSGWSGDCTGNQAQSVTMSANRSCTATFTAEPPPPTGWSSLGAVTVQNVEGRPIAGFTNPNLPPIVAYLESAAGPVLHLLVKSYDLSTQGWGPFGPGIVNPSAVANTTSFDFDVGGAGALVAWNEGNQIKLSQFTGNHWATLPQDLGIAGTNVPKDHVQLSTRTIGAVTEIFVAWREVIGGSKLAVAHLDSSLNIISREYVSDIDTLADMQMVISPSGLATIAAVTGDGVLPGPTFVLRETTTGWEQLGGDATPGSDAFAMLVHGFGLTYEASGAPIMIGNKGASLFAHRFNGTSWVPLTGTDGTFTAIPAGQLVGGVSTLNQGTSVAFSRMEFVSSLGIYGVYFDVLTWDGSAWAALAPTLALPATTGVPTGGVFFSAGKLDTGPLYIVRSRDIGLSGGIEVHRYAP